MNERTDECRDGAVSLWIANRSVHGKEEWCNESVQLE